MRRVSPPLIPAPKRIGDPIAIGLLAHPLGDAGACPYAESEVSVDQREHRIVRKTPVPGRVFHTASARRAERETAIGVALDAKPLLMHEPVMRAA